jgi:hypothetical protein
VPSCDACKSKRKLKRVKQGLWRKGAEHGEKVKNLKKSEYRGLQRNGAEPGSKQKSIKKVKKVSV